MSKKYTKKEVNYVKNAKEDHCDECTMYRKNHKCISVEGYIYDEGHCDIFKRKLKLPVQNAK